MCFIVCAAIPTRQLYHINIIEGWFLLILPPHRGKQLTKRHRHTMKSAGNVKEMSETDKKACSSMSRIRFVSRRRIRNHYQTVLSCYHRYHTKDTFFDANSTIHILGTMRTHDIVRAFRHYRLITTSSVRVDVCVLDTRVTVIVHGFRSVLFDVFKLCARRLNPCTFDRTANRYDPREKSDGARFFVAVYYYLFFVAIAFRQRQRVVRKTPGENNNDNTLFVQ